MPKPTKNIDADLDEFVSDLKKSQGTKKIILYIKDLTDRKDFQDDVKKFRTKFGIPTKGFSKNDKYILDDHQCPQPLKWAEITLNADKKFWDSFRATKNALFKKYAIPSAGNHMVGDYILRNQVEIPALIGALCQIASSKQYTDAFLETSSTNEQYPILIQISPYASLRDILDYIKTTYKWEIQPLKKKYAKRDISLGKLKARDPKTQKRDAFIFKNRSLPLKKIAELLRENKYGAQDQGNISKIISLEKKRRKEV